MRKKINIEIYTEDKKLSAAIEREGLIKDCLPGNCWGIEFESGKTICGTTRLSMSYDEIFEK